MNFFVIFHSSYCPVVWMFHSHKLNARINRLQEKASRVVYRDFDSFSEEKQLYNFTPTKPTKTDDWYI